MKKLALFTVLLVLILTSCSETKYVAEGDYLLDKIQVKSDQPIRGLSTADMRLYVRQTGNSRWFSTLKIPLYSFLNSALGHINQVPCGKCVEAN